MITIIENPYNNLVEDKIDNKEDNVNNLNECDEIMHNNVLLDDENDIKYYLMIIVLIIIIYM